MVSVAFASLTRLRQELLAMTEIYPYRMFGPCQGGRTVMVRSLWSCRRMTAQYPCDLTGTAWAASDNLVIPVRRLCGWRKSLPSLYKVFGLNDHLKS